MTVFEYGLELLNRGESFGFAVILSGDGSTPRGEGSMMIIREDSIFATIGGGLMEAEIIETARKEVMPCHTARVCEIDMYANSNIPSDMICGGACRVLVAGISGGDENMKKVFRAAAEAESLGKRAWIFYIYENTPSGGKFSCCVNSGGVLTGDFEGCPGLDRQMLLNPVRVAVHGDSAENVEYVIHEINPTGKMYIFGGGHVSYEVAKLAVNLGFKVTVVDDRAEYANPERFPGCKTFAIDSFDTMPDFETDGRSYILIITRGHAHDKTVLKWAMGKPRFYLGMIGSKTKRDNLYRRLNEENGIPMEELRKVKCPIGLTIGAETPAEIAVSIMAEIIMETKAKDK